jgi:hypothetical protein
VLPSKERASCIKDSAAFSFDEPQSQKWAANGAISAVLVQMPDRRTYSR